MSDDESFDEFYAKLNDIVNSAYNLGEIYVINQACYYQFARINIIEQCHNAKGNR